MLYHPYVLEALARARHEDELRRMHAVQASRHGRGASRAAAMDATTSSIPRPAFTGIAVGMVLMALFTVSWGLAPLFVWARAGMPLTLIAAGVAGCLLVDAIRLLIDTRQLPVATSSEDRGEQARRWRLFGATFGVEGVTIAVVSTVLSVADLGDAVPVAVALVVGLHFYPFATIFRRRVDLVFATSLSGAATVGLVMMARGEAPAPTVIVFVSLAAALTTAAYGSFFAVQHRRLRHRGLTRVHEVLGTP